MVPGCAWQLRWNESAHALEASRLTLAIGAMPCTAKRDGEIIDNVRNVLQQILRADVGIKSTQKSRCACQAIPLLSCKFGCLLRIKAVAAPSKGL
jgi:hypothetical protein